MVKPQSNPLSRMLVECRNVTRVGRVKTSKLKEIDFFLNELSCQLPAIVMDMETGLSG